MRALSEFIRARLSIMRARISGGGGPAFGTKFQSTVIDNLVRAIKKLRSYGVEHSVVTADHGHLFFPTDRDESMKIDPPGGKQVELHRRCWIGRGGTTPPGCLRVSAAALGYDSDLDFVTRGCRPGLFKCGPVRGRSQTRTAPG